MDEKFIKYLPFIGAGFVILLLLINFKPEEPNDSVAQVIKNINTQAPNQVSNKPSPEGKNMDKTKMDVPNQVIDQNKSYTAVFKTTMGDFKIKLFANETPMTVNNFVYLAQNKFYDGLIFHRVIKDFMIQGGDPVGNGTGGPGYRFNDEVSKQKIVKGSLAMANAGPNTNGSQFFIVTAPATPWLDGKHTNFGIVTEGLDIVEKISLVKTGSADKPVEDVVIKSVEIIQE